MKKHMLWILALVTMLFASCTSNVTTENTQPQFSGEEKISSTENLTTQDFLQKVTPIVWGKESSGDIIRLDAESLEEYNTYFSTLKVRPDMVYYEKVAGFGAFNYWMGYFSPMHCTYDAYWYTLCDVEEYSVSIAIFHRSHSPTPEYEFVSLDYDVFSDLRFAPTVERAKMEHEGFTYTYIRGKLLSIVWVENGIEFRITGNGVISDYPNSTDTLLGKMLCVDTFHEAAETIRNMKITEGLPYGMIGENSAAYPAGYFEKLSKATPAQLNEIEKLPQNYSTLEFHRETMIRMDALDVGAPRLTLEQAEEIVAELKEEYTQNGVSSFAAICPTFLARFNEIAGAPDIRDGIDDYGDWVAYVYILDETTGEKICVREDGNVIYMKDGESKTLFSHRKYIEKSST